jgi:hypothetical protein
MFPFYLESELVKPVVRYLKEQGFIVKREVQIGFCRADIIAFKDKKVISVELKLDDWKKAIIQAKNYQLGTDYVYLAFPLLKSFKLLRKAETLLKKEGIGLLTVNEDTCKVCKIIEARQSRRNLGTITLNELKRNWKKRSKMKFF